MALVSHVLRLALGHDQSSPVLVATSSAEDASHPLDLELLATDDQKAYVMTREWFFFFLFSHGSTTRAIIPALYPSPCVHFSRPLALSIWPRESAFTAVSLIIHGLNGTCALPSTTKSSTLPHSLLLARPSPAGKLHPAVLPIGCG